MDQPIVEENLLPKPSFHERLRRWRLKVRRTLKMEYWFPHVPMAILLGALGFFQILPALDHLTHSSIFSGELSQIAAELAETSFRGIPKSLLGTLLLVMSLTLLTRSRMAWVLAFVISLMMLISDTRLRSGLDLELLLTIIFQTRRVLE